jgi:hypothetical protein
VEIFLKNQVEDLLSIDFFVVATATHKAGAASGSHLLLFYSLRRLSGCTSPASNYEQIRPTVYTASRIFLWRPQGHYPFTPVFIYVSDNTRTLLISMCNFKRKGILDREDLVTYLQLGKRDEKKGGRP